MTGQSREKTAAQNTAALLASRVVVSGLGWAGSVFIARALSAEAWGQYSFVFGLLALVSVLADLGVGRVVLARLAQDAAQPGTDQAEDARLVASSFIALRVALGGLGYAVALAYVLLVDHPSEVERATAVAGVVLLIATPSNALTVIFQSRLRMGAVAGAESIGQVLQLALTVAAALFAPELLVFVLAVIANETVRLALKIRSLRRDPTAAPPHRRIEVRRWGPMLREAVPLALGATIVALLHRIDLVLLSRLDTFESIGQYSIGYKFADLLPLVASAVMVPWTTLLVLAWPDRPGEFRDRCRTACLVIGALASAAVVGFWPAGDALVTGLYGSEYAPAVDAARLLVAGAAVGMLVTAGLTVLVASGRQRVYPWVGLLGLLLNVGLNLLLIPRMSFYGAAVATVITEVVLVVALWSAVSRTVPAARLLPLRGLTVLAGTSAALVTTAQALRDVLPWFVLSGTGVLAVVAASWLLDVPGVRRLPRMLLERRERSR